MSTIQIGGNTYQVREYIKSAGGRWQASSKTWAIDDAKWLALAAAKPALMRGCMIVGGVIGGPVAAPTTTSTRSVYTAGPCRSCGSYCYGDCSAN